MKEFLLLIREKANYDCFSVQETLINNTEYIRWMELLIEYRNFKDGNFLDSNGITLEKGIVTTGPFIEKELHVSGYYILNANSLEEAKELAEDCPDLKRRVILEIREIRQLG